MTAILLLSTLLASSPTGGQGERDAILPFAPGFARTAHAEGLVTWIRGKAPHLQRSRPRARYVYNWAGEPYMPDYIDGSGNVTLRIEIPGPEQQVYSATFDQVGIRFLRASEDE